MGTSIPAYIWITLAVTLSTLLVNVVGLLLLSIKGGHYFGEASKSLSFFNLELQEIKKAQADHVESDNAEFKAIRQDIANLAIIVAGLKK